MFRIRIQVEPIDPAPAPDLADERCGARVEFRGQVRQDTSTTPLSHLVLEHFPGVTEAEIERIVVQARARWPLHQVEVVHRVGRINVGEEIVRVTTTSPHRQAAYEANAFIMDYLKTEAPFWKQAVYVDGSAPWVEAKASDQTQRQRWATQGTQPPAARRIGALVLAGGQGLRMQARNKGLQRLGERPLVQHVVDRLRPQVDFLAISANRDLADYAALGLPVITDAPEWQDQGPLAGLASALHHLPPNLDALLIVPCDTPFLPTDLVARLAASLFRANGPAAVMAYTPPTLHPSVALLRTGLLLSLVPHLQRQSGRSLRGWLTAAGAESVAFACADAFANLNDLDALQAAQARV